MLLFLLLWSLTTVAALAGAGYSHYRYRVRNNAIYRRRFDKAEEPAMQKRHAAQPGGDR